MAKKSQVQKFRDAARAVETHGSEEQFNAALKGLAKKPREAESAKGKTPKPNATKNGNSQP
jgi:hypothetical protein